jgi:hypothetical protein
MRHHPGYRPAGAEAMQQAQLAAQRFLLETAWRFHGGHPLLGTPALPASPPLHHELRQLLEDSARRFRGGLPLADVLVPPPPAAKPRRQVAATPWPAPPPALAEHRPSYIELSRQVRIKFGVRTSPRLAARPVAPAPAPPPVIVSAPSEVDRRFAEGLKRLREKFGTKPRPRSRR